MSNRDLVRQVSAVRDLANQADHQWEAENVGSSPRDDQWVAYLVRRAYYAATALAESEGYDHLASELASRLNSPDLDLLCSAMVHSIGEPRLISTDPIHHALKVIELLNEAPDNPAFDPSLDHAVRILRNFPAAAARDGRAFDNEASVDKFAEVLLLPTFPDLDSNSSVNLPAGTRRPDSEIGSISTLIEYKYLKVGTALSKMVDELQADVRNYADQGFDNLIIFVVQPKRFAREANLKKTLLRQDTSFDRIEIIVVEA